MDYDVSISIGTTANLGDLAKANKAVQDLSKAAKQVPDSLLSGGVGGTAAPAYTGAASGGGMTWRLEGAAELSHAVKTMDGALRQEFHRDLPAPGQECILVVPEHQHAYFPARQAASLGQQYNAVLEPIQRRPAKPQKCDRIG